MLTGSYCEINCKSLYEGRQSVRLSFDFRLTHRQVEWAMPFPRLRFTIRQLIGLIAICGVACAVLRTPVGFVALAFGFVVPGFLIERASGGDGVIGGALSASLIAGGLAMAGSALFLWIRPDLSVLVSCVSFVFASLVIGFFLGVVLGSILYAILKLTRTLLESPYQDESNRSIRWRRLSDGPVERG